MKNIFTYIAIQQCVGTLQSKVTFCKIVFCNEIFFDYVDRLKAEFSSDYWFAATPVNPS